MLKITTFCFLIITGNVGGMFPISSLAPRSEKLDSNNQFARHFVLTDTSY